MRDNVPLVSKAMTVLGAFSVTKDSGKSSIFMLSFTYGFPLYTEQSRYINFHETTDQSINQSIILRKHVKCTTSTVGDQTAT